MLAISNPNAERLRRLRRFIRYQMFETILSKWLQLEEDAVLTVVENDYDVEDEWVEVLEPGQNLLLLTSHPWESNIFLAHFFRTHFLEN